MLQTFKAFKIVRNTLVQPLKINEKELLLAFKNGNNGRYFKLTNCHA